MMGLLAPSGKSCSAFSVSSCRSRCALSLSKPAANFSCNIAKPSPAWAVNVSSPSMLCNLRSSGSTNKRALSSVEIQSEEHTSELQSRMHPLSFDLRHWDYVHPVQEQSPQQHPAPT